jgi:hypothetical protein
MSSCRSSKSSFTGGTAAVRNSDKISLKKREYRLVEQQGDKTVVTNHKAFNKGPGDAAVKLSQPFFKDKADGSKVRLTITKVSDGRNKGAIYEYEIEQKLIEIGKDEKVPESIIIKKGNKQYRLKRYATKIKTYTPTMMQRSKANIPLVKEKRSESKPVSSKSKKTSRVSVTKKNPIESNESSESNQKVRSKSKVTKKSSSKSKKSSSILDDEPEPAGRVSKSMRSASKTSISKKH